MASFPTLSFGGVALYPLTRRIAAPVAVHRSLDDTEQRWKKSAVLNRFTLLFTGLLRGLVYSKTKETPRGPMIPQFRMIL